MVAGQLLPRSLARRLASAAGVQLAILLHERGRQFAVAKLASRTELIVPQKALFARRRRPPPLGPKRGRSARFEPVGGLKWPMIGF